MSLGKARADAGGGVDDGVDDACTRRAPDARRPAVRRPLPDHLCHCCLGRQQPQRRRHLLLDEGPYDYHCPITLASSAPGVQLLISPLISSTVVSVPDTMQQLKRVPPVITSGPQPGVCQAERDLHGNGDLRQDPDLVRGLGPACPELLLHPVCVRLGLRGSAGRFGTSSSRQPSPPPTLSPS